MKSKLSGHRVWSIYLFTILLMLFSGIAGTTNAYASPYEALTVTQIYDAPEYVDSQPFFEDFVDGLEQYESFYPVLTDMYYLEFDAFWTGGQGGGFGGVRDVWITWTMNGCNAVF